MALAPHIARSLALQRRIGRLALPWVAGAGIFYLRVVRGNRVADIERVRREFREIAREGRPLLICANHLTMIDSFFVHWALASPVDYFLHYRRFAWNVPARENFQRGVLLRLMSYLGKTVPIDRGGGVAHHRLVLSKLAHLLEEGDSVTIFPEAGRSRSGRVDPKRVASGVGQLLRDVPEARVLCVYQRGVAQKSWGFQPARGDVIHVFLEPFTPSSEHEGLRAARDYSEQIILHLQAMEERFFRDRET